MGLTTLPPSMSRLSRLCGILNISQYYRPPHINATHKVILCLYDDDYCVKVTLQLTVSQSVSISRCPAHSGTFDQILLSVRRLLSEICCLVSVGCPLWQEVESVICQSVCSNLSVCTLRIYISFVWHGSAMYVQHTRRFFQFWLGTTY
jgi:hypothetical protein